MFDSPWWKKIERLEKGVEGASKGWFSRSVCLVLDDWRYTLFWSKPWMTGCIVKNKYSRLFPLSMDVKVEDYKNYLACDQSFEGVSLGKLYKIGYQQRTTLLSVE